MDKTFAEMKDLFENIIVTDEQFEMIDENPNCLKECNGNSGSKVGCTWYTVYEYDFENEKKLGGEFDIYVK